ncbi:hypothetical protein Rrhod_4132 [Rhodococcus rhodnii LMG 5362]|uniref:Integral membrane protein n=2 Tax=Rhodococcus rhodnii TaxID=38312 RepID=R7WHF0_9NOCA|nr:hypothetical protein Rrhod_4132 [Rhodococcus rhodnii LMG 5362]
MGDVGLRRLQIGVVLTSALAGAILGAGLLARVWSDCDVGIVSANLLLLTIFYLPVLFSVLTGIGLIVVRTLGRRRPWAAMAVTLVLCVVVVWLSMSVMHPDDYPGPFCPTGVPEWWPAAIPL